MRVRMIAARAAAIVKEYKEIAPDQILLAKKICLRGLGGARGGGGITVGQRRNFAVSRARPTAKIFGEPGYFGGARATENANLAPRRQHPLVGVQPCGGGQPRWSDEGGELFYVVESILMAVPVSTRPTLTIGKPQRLFSSGDLGSAGSRYTHDITPDGKQFVMAEAVVPDDASDEPEFDGEPQTSIRIVENWYAEFRDRKQD